MEMIRRKRFRLTRGWVMGAILLIFIASIFGWLRITPGPQVSKATWTLVSEIELAPYLNFLPYSEVRCVVEGEVISRKANALEYATWDEIYTVQKKVARLSEWGDKLEYNCPSYTLP